MHAYTELLRPSVVSHLQLLGGPNENTLRLFLVRGGSLLQVYEVSLPSGGVKWLAEFPLMGHVVSMRKFGPNTLLLAFAVAKMVVLEFDEAGLKFKTRSMHYYEQTIENQSTFGEGVQKLSVDVERKVAVFLYQRELAAYVRPVISDPLVAAREQENQLKSQVFSRVGLAANIQVSSILDMEYLPAFDEPTLAVLCAQRENWAGLAAVRGTNSNCLVLLAQKSSTSFNFKSAVVARLENLSLFYTSVVSLRKNSSCAIALLPTKTALGVLTEDLEITEIFGDEGLDFENCVVEQFESSPVVFIALANGENIVADLKLKSFNRTEAGGALPTSVSAENGVIVVGSALTGVSIYKYELPEMTAGDKKPVEQKLGGTESFKEIYLNSVLAGLPSGTSNVLANLKLINSLKSTGPLTSLARVDDGLVCATNSGMLFVDQKLKLDIVKTTKPERTLKPGQFWLTNKGSRNILVFNVVQTGEPLPTFEFRDAETDKHVEPPSVLNHKKHIVAVCSTAEFVYVVQSSSVYKLQTKDWELVSKHSFHSNEEALTAELNGDYMLVRFDQFSSVLSATDLHFLKTCQSPVTDILNSNLVLLNGSAGTLTIHDLETKTETHYNVAGLEECVEPNNLGENTDIPEIASVFLVNFGNEKYICLHSERQFVVYLWRDNLLKQFTVPFSVNVSPIWLPETEMFVFPSRSPHVLVKSEKTAFECHLLDFHGKLVDAFQHPNANIVLLDDKNNLQYCKPNKDVDYLSNSLPLRYFPLPEDATPVQVAYVQSARYLIVGANVQKEVTETKAEEDVKTSNENENETEQNEAEQDESEQNEAEQNEAEQNEAEKNEAEQNETEPTNEAETADDASANTEVKTITHGRVYVIAVDTLELLTSVELDETLLSLQPLSPDLTVSFDMSFQQHIVVGTSAPEVETEQTNGHLVLYGLETREGNLKCKERYSVLLRGPVSAIYELMDFLVVAHGQQIKVFSCVQGLTPVGFMFTDNYMQDLKCVRNIIVLGERMHAPRLVNFMLQPKRLDLLSSADSLLEGNGMSPTSAVDVVSSGARQDLGVVYATENGRIQIFMFDPELPGSLGGPRLVPHRSFYIGHTCTALCQSDVAGNDDIISFGITSDGSVFSVRPLEEAQFRSLYLLTQQMLSKEPSTANLNPRMHRACFEPHSAAGATSTALHEASSPSLNLIDVNFAQRFWSLDRKKQQLYTRSLGYNGLHKVQLALNGEGRNPMRI